MPALENVPRVTESKASAPKPQPQKPAIKYPDLVVGIDDGNGGVELLPLATVRITGPMAAKLLELETESEYALRCAREYGLASTENEVRELGIKLQFHTFVEPITGEKVICWNNLHNRPFKMPAALAYKQEILTFNWAGPTTCPGETVNAEPITISRTEQIVSGQNRLGAAWMAWIEWKEKYDDHKRVWPREKFPEGPYLETLVIYGVSDAQKVIQTVDTGEKRSESDAFFTGNTVERVFGKDKADTLTRKAKEEVARMLGHAVDFCWVRMGWNDRLIKTNRTAQEFLDNFPTIHKAVRTIFDVNQSRQLSLMYVNAGTCAGALFLMAQGKTNPQKRVDSEKGLDMTLLAKAEEFWRLLSKKEGFFNLVKNTLGKITSVEGEELNGRAVEKFCVIAKAWRIWLDGGKLTPADKDNPAARELALQTYEDEDGNRHLVDPPDFGGIDRGPKVREPEVDDAPDEQEVEEEKRKAETRRSEELRQIVEESPAQELARRQQADIKAQNAALLRQKAEAKKNGQLKPRTPALATDKQPRPAKAPVKK
jgi:hypothetical protein